jgi:dTDP-4-dehydrorhamnose 3,5-epimerase
VYKATDYYSPERSHGVLWNDPSLGIKWPVDETSAVMSDADKIRPRLCDLPVFFD